MVASVKVSAADWARAQQLFRTGLSYQRIADELEKEAGRPVVSHAIIRRRAMRESWMRDVGAPDSVGPANQTLAEKQQRAEIINATSQFNLATATARLTEQLAYASGRLIHQMFIPHEVVEVKLVGQGANMGQMVQTVRTELNEPSPKDKAALAAAASQLIDRLQLLTGGVTSRTEIGPIGDRAAAEARLRMVRDELSERRQVVLNKEAEDKAKLADGEVG
jgi:hypothetical protein